MDAQQLAKSTVDHAVERAVSMLSETPKAKVKHDSIEECWNTFKYNLKSCKPIENLIGGKTNAMDVSEFLDLTSKRVNRLRDNYLEFLATQPIRDASDEALRRFSRYTDNIPLKDYENALDLVPSLVNLVSLAEAFPLDGSSLPFDLRYIASKCKCAIYFAPRRFTAVQIAFDEPRSRILLFHTGRVVGTGCTGPFAAKLAVTRALNVIARDAKVLIGVRNYAVINQVGAVSLNASIDCDSLADAHTATSHYDKDSFVGLAWRPDNEAVCAETYSTGKTNLPGSSRMRSLLRSFSRMAGEMYRHSDKPEKALKFAPHLSNAHKPLAGAKPAPRLVREKENRKKRQKVAEDIWANSDDEDARGGRYFDDDDGMANDDSLMTQIFG